MLKPALVMAHWMKLMADTIIGAAQRKLTDSCECSLINTAYIPVLAARVRLQKTSPMLHSQP